MHCKPPPSRQKPKARDNSSRNLRMDVCCSRCGRAGIDRRNRGIGTALGRLHLCNSREKGRPGCYQRLPPSLKRGLVGAPDLLQQHARNVRQHLAKNDVEAAGLLGVDLQTLRALIDGQPVIVSADPLPAARGQSGRSPMDDLE